MHPTLAEGGLYLAPVLLKKPSIQKTKTGQIQISAQPGVEIRYTLDGSEPGPESLLYTSPFAVTAPTVRARCMIPGQAERMGEIASATFDLRKAKWRIHAVSSEQADSDEGAKMAIDGNKKTLWHSQWRPTSPEHPHSLTIDFGERLAVSGFLYTPRSDANRNGTLLGYRIELSGDGTTWTTAKEAEFQNMVNNPTERRVDFEQSHQAQYMRLTALSEVSGQPWASVAELDVISD